MLTFPMVHDVLTFVRLCLGIAYAKRLGLKAYAVTNAFWATDFKKANDILDTLGKVDSIDISCDIFHQEFIPLQNVINAARACIERDIKTVVRTLHFGFNKKDKIKAKAALKRKFKPLLGKLIRKVNFSSGPFYLSGRALRHPQIFKVELVSEIPKRNSCVALRNLFVSYQGEVYPCCGSLFSNSVKIRRRIILGNLNKEPLSKIEERIKNIFWVNFLAKYGASELVKFIEALKGKNFTQKLYCTIQKDDGCQLCYRIFENDTVASFLGKLSQDRHSHWGNGRK